MTTRVLLVRSSAGNALADELAELGRGELEVVALGSIEEAEARAEPGNLLAIDMSMIGPADIQRLARVAERAEIIGLDGTGQGSAEVGSALPMVDVLGPGACDAGLLKRAVLRARDRAASVRGEGDQGWRLGADDLRLLLEANERGALLVNDAGIIVMVNETAARMLRVPAQSLEGQLFPIRLSSGGVMRLDLGDHPPVQVSVSPLKLGGRRASLITLQDEAEADHGERARARLLHSDRLAAVGQLAAGVAHEVNNPAAYVTANVSILGEHMERLRAALGDLRGWASETAGAEEALERCFAAHDLRTLVDESRDIITESVEGLGRITAIVRDLKNFSRIDREQVELLHPNQVVNSACNLVYNQLRHRAMLIKDLGDLPRITGDRGKLTQVLMNLLLNAAQAIPEDAQGEQYVRVMTRAESDRLIISVIDTGTGIAEEHLDRVFEPFFTTKARDRGTGLGLSICADIARQHGGDLRVYSALGKGSQFDLVLPRETGLAPGRVSVSQPAPVTREGSARILLIDDEPMLLRAYRRLLSPPHEVVTADGGEAALQILAEDSAFDVILCDLMMPKVDGPMFFQELERRFPKLPTRVVFCSGGAFTARAKEFIAAVGNTFLEKPTSAAALHRAIAEVMEAADQAEPRLAVGGGGAI